MPISTEQEEQIKNLLRETLKKKLSNYKRESSYMPFLSTPIQDKENSYIVTLKGGNSKKLLDLRY